MQRKNREAASAEAFRRRRASRLTPAASSADMIVVSHAMAAISRCRGRGAVHVDGKLSMHPAAEQAVANHMRLNR
jgi:ABC-type polysaccharide/polyol phosphate transport system ATPase subunit